MLLRSYWGGTKMAKELIQQFKVVNELYQKLIENTTESFEELKKDNEKQVKTLEKEMLFMNMDWEQEEKKLMTLIETKCAEKGVEPKITKLVDFYTVEEKEKILYELEYSVQSYRKLRTNIMMCQEMAYAKKETMDTFLEVIVHGMREEGEGRRTIIDKKM